VKIRGTHGDGERLRNFLVAQSLCNQTQYFVLALGEAVADARDFATPTLHARDLF